MIAYLFPGQGAQKNGMGEALFKRFAAQTKMADAILGYSIQSLCLDNNNKLNQTQYTQPALYIVNALSYQQRIEDTGKEPDYLAGHSLGEYNALQACGAFSFEDGLKLVIKRGELMSRADKGAMAAVLNMEKDQITACLLDHGLHSIDIANDNSLQQAVIAGSQADIVDAQPWFEKKGALYIPLNTSGAFHSRFMLPFKEEFSGYIKRTNFSTLRIPVISNTHATPYKQDQLVDNLIEQLVKPVRWRESMKYLIEQGVTTFEELGVGDVLTKLAIRNQQDYRVAKNSRQEGQKNFQNDQLALSNRQVTEWNNHYPVGTQTVVHGYNERLETRTKAMLLFGHRAAVYMKGYKGYFALDDITIPERYSA